MATWFMERAAADELGVDSVTGNKSSKIMLFIVGDKALFFSHALNHW